MNSTGSAVFSEDRRYRYLLTRRVGASQSRVLFIMLNPSAADEERNDPTIRRCIGFARDWGFGFLEVVNLFALMSTDPKGLLETEDPVGPDNDATIQAALKRADKVILAWGNQGSRHRERAAHVMKMALDASNPHHLGMTKLGFPRHPLLLPRSTRPTPFS